MCLNPWWQEFLTHLIVWEYFIAWTDFKLSLWSARNVYVFAACNSGPYCGYQTHVL
jgi:hypothetical protein